MKKQTKKQLIKERSDFKSYDDYEDYMWEKIDNGFKIPQPTDKEMDLIHSMARTYAEILKKEVETEESSAEQINIPTLYQLLFKLRMLEPDEEHNEN